MEQKQTFQLIKFFFNVKNQLNSTRMQQNMMLPWLKNERRYFHIEYRAEWSWTATMQTLCSTGHWQWRGYDDVTKLNNVSSVVRAADWVPHYDAYLTSHDPSRQMRKLEGKTCRWTIAYLGWNMSSGLGSRCDPAWYLTSLLFLSS